MTDYRSAGVDIAKGANAVERIKKHVARTFTDDVLQGIGAFAGCLGTSALKDMSDPVLVSTIDSVGTKTMIAHALNRWENIGKDMVGHSGNDIVCQGAAPLFFLDYIASAVLDSDIIELLVSSMADSCKELGCVLIGGEMAEMPQVYHDGAHDIVGTMVGIVDRAKMITGKDIAPGDALIALPSNGLHTNGYSLARSVFTDMTENVSELGMSIGEALLLPHTSYVATVRKLHDAFSLKGIAHITGGGIPGNLPRILHGLGADIVKDALRVPPIFTLLQERGNVSDEAMYEALNMGAGMILVTDAEKKDAVLSTAPESFLIGEVSAEPGVRIR